MMRPLLRSLALSSLAPPLLLGCVEPSIEQIPQDPSYLGTSLGQVAVVAADYDRIEELLTRLEVPFTLYDGFAMGPPEDAALSEAYAQDLEGVETLLSERNLLTFYDAIFLNCGIRGTGNLDPHTLTVDESLLSDNEALRNLKDFVEGGGQLFVSDRSYALLEAALPSLIDFLGDDRLPSDALAGEAGTVLASVEPESLQTSLKRTTVEVPFVESDWTVALSTEGAWLSGAPGEKALEAGASEQVPLLIRLEVGEGAIVFSSFHNLPTTDQAMTDLQLALLRSMGGR